MDWFLRENQAGSISRWVLPSIFSMHFPVQYPILWKSWISWVIVQFLYHHVQYPMSSFKKSWVENVIVFSTAAWRSADICCARPRRLAIWEAWWEWCHHFGIFWIFLEYVEHVKNTTYGSKKKQAMKYFTTSVEKKMHNPMIPRMISESVFISSSVQSHGPLFQIGSFEANHHIEKLPQGNSAGAGKAVKCACPKMVDPPKIFVLTGEMM